MSGLSDLLSTSFDWHIHDIYTSIPATIINIRDIGQQRVDVKPCINIITPTGEDKEHPTILSVPLIFPATSTSALTLKVNVGDPVLIMFSQRCIDSFKAGDGSPSRPLDYRKLDKRDAVAIIGLFPFSEATNAPAKRNWPHSTNDTVLVHNIGTSKETEIRFKDDGSLVINSHNAVTVNCSSATVNANTTVNGNLQINGDVNSTGTVTATTDVVGGGKSLKTHTHIGSPTAPTGAISPTGAPV